MAVLAKAGFLLPGAAFSRSLDAPCSTRAASPRCLRAGLPRNLRNLRQPDVGGRRNVLGGRRNVLGGSLPRASGLSSASSSFQARLCLVFTCPTGKVREGKRIGVQASLLGVGAPEALVIGVVALLVFGPKGLAEVARTLGKSLRSFQPTIKELQQVSREFKATLEQEIGLDELRSPSSYDFPPTSTPSRPSSVSSTPSSTSATEAPPAAPQKENVEEASVQPQPYTTEDYVRITEDQAHAFVSEEQLKASEAAAWGGPPPVKPTGQTSSEDQTQVSAKSAVEGSVAEQKGNTPTESVENSSDNGSPKV